MCIRDSHCDVRNRTTRDPDWVKEGMEAGDVMEVTGGVRHIRIRNADVRKEICWITNCKGIARRLQERQDIDQGSDEWMWEVTEGLEEQMR
eukprot:14975847-Alexandrium_andersonii.AAC.1